MLPENARNLAVRGALTGLCLEYVEGVSRRFQRTPLPPTIVAAEDFRGSQWLLPQFLPQFAQEKAPKEVPRGFFALSV